MDVYSICCVSYFHYTAFTFIILTVLSTPFDFNFIMYIFITLKIGCWKNILYVKFLLRNTADNYFILIKWKSIFIFLLPSIFFHCRLSRISLCIFLEFHIISNKAYIILVFLQPINVVLFC